jgi:secreted protein with Ig-like and vWFA domain
MSGFPIEKAKEAMRLALDGLNPQDTFNLIDLFHKWNLTISK